MKMVQNFRDIATSVDVINTLSGGISQPLISFDKEDTGRQIRISIPGVLREAMQVEIHNNRLSIYYNIPVNVDGTLIRVPNVVYNKPIPYFIEMTAIKASYENKELVVKLPYNELANGYDKKIDVEE
ncbi:MAG TPA: Hsp20/alpha crystallin family protein [Cyclobacteriaceae bacterium]